MRPGAIILNHSFLLPIGHNHIEESRMARAIHLPLWSNMMSQGMGGSDHAHVGGVSVSNNHVSPNHPLLMGRQASTTAMDGPSGSRSTSRGIGNTYKLLVD